ncbi:hypothetical protein ADP71_04520 [Vitreoscilla sp. C1]|uniref:hypothetical protein n=1 Tax=Vitreoscilla sp. (strain C1) TaxID=96942 RepID=UPI000CDBE9F0|nr:hypothetical protein [Vitreoscilla sp. C1]AUZ04244.1 hypothetical protein ADP71_04520 [Vitreoscilla sp. C1]
MTFSALSDENHSYSIENLTFENHGDGLSIYGDIQILRDQQGLKYLKEIKTIIDGAILQLQNTEALPEQLILGQNNTEIDNPFL